MALTQANRFAAIDTPLGTDVLVLRGFSFREQLGRLFQMELELLSEDPDIDFDDIVGENVSLRLELVANQTRFFNGHISRFVQTAPEGKLARYRATMVPWLWFLTRTADCRIFQKSMPEPPDKMTVPGIIKKVFKDHGFEDVKDDGLTQTYREWEYCVQYRETDFNFVSRLMEQEGIYYFFTHENGKHTLVLADSISAHEPFPLYDTIFFRPPSQPGTAKGDVVEWVVEQEVQPGAYILNDFNFEKPKKAFDGSLVARSTIERQHAQANFEVFDYPGEYLEHEEGETCARLRIEELQAQHRTIRGRATARGVGAGFLFNLSDHPRRDQNQQYLITSASIDVFSDLFTTAGKSDKDSFACAFTALDSEEPFRAARLTPKPIIQGPQNAIVVGPSGDEIHTDKYGRVKVQFPWDRYGKADENSSCFVRVSQAWAGKKWGAIYIPRIGQEVVVEFLEGDPDQPIITGRVYNGEAMPPYDLPANATVSTVKSNTSKGGHGYNEIRFEDKKGSEQVYIHSQARMDVRVRESLYETTGGNREEQVGHDDKGDHNSLVCGDINHKLKGGDFSATEKKFNASVKDDVVEDFQKNQTSAIKERVTLNAKEIVGEAQNTLSLKSDKVIAQGAQGLHLKAGAVHIEGTQEIHLKSGGNFVVIDAAGVTIKGMLVKINSGGSAQSADGPLVAQAPTIEDPIEAAAAVTAVPGQGGGLGGGGGGAPRARNSRTVPLLRAPEPPPPPRPGVVGWGSTGGVRNADEIELVEVVEVVRHSGTETTQPVQTRAQYVNLDASVDTTRAHPEFGRVIRLKARVRWRTGDILRSLAGNEVHWYHTPGGGNRAGLAPASCKHGFQVQGGPQNFSQRCDAQGWTPVVEFYVSQYGGDTFEVKVTLESGYTGGITAGSYTVRRRLFYELDCMTRVGGGTFADRADTGAMQTKFAALFLDLVSSGTDASPAYQRVLTSAEAPAWTSAVRDGGGAPRYYHLVLVDTIAVPKANATQSFAVPSRGRWTISFSANTYTLDPRNWFVSATWRDTVTNASGPVAANKFSALSEAGTYAAADDRMVTDVDLSSAGSNATNALELVVTVVAWNALSGLQTGPATILGMRWREGAFAGAALVSSTLNTMMHEPGHAMGLASTTLPDGTACATTYYKAGHHCNNIANACVMYEANSVHTDFCASCADALKGRNLSRLPQSGSAAFA